MRAAIALLCLLAGCRYRFDERADSSTGDGVVDPDAPKTSLGGCWPRWFDHSVRLGGLRQLGETSTALSEHDHFISQDGTTVYFARGTTGSRDVYAARRTDRALPFDTPAIASDLSTPQDDGKVSMTSDGLVVAHSSERAGSQLFDLWELTRTTTGDSFGSASQAPYAAINTTGNEYDPHLADDGLSIYYAAPLQPGQEIRVATRPSRSAPFGASTKVLGLGLGVAADPMLSPDQLLIAFVGAPMPGDIGQLYYATRAAIGEAFQDVRAMTDVNSVTTLDGDPQITADGCELFFMSTRTGNRELFVATVQ